MTESFTAKEEDGLTSFLILDVLEAKIFRYNFLEGIMSEKMSVVHHQLTEMGHSIFYPHPLPPCGRHISVRS